MTGLMPTPQAPDPAARLREVVRGEVLAPGDPGYDEARRVFPGGVDRRPAAVARPLDDADVAEVVRFAARSGLPLAVRSGAHSEHGVCDDGVVLDLGALRALHLDVEDRTAWAEAGLRAGEYTTAVGSHGLATGFGDTGSVGVGGITLGGGVGYLVRKHGLTIDNVLAADVVTADGRVRRVDADHDPDLFWAIRGGGGNFGVVTRFRFRVHEVPEVVGGVLVLPATPAVIAAFVALADAAPDGLSTIANVMPAPPMPFIPENRHGRLVVLAMLVHAGDRAEGERAVAPFRAIAPPIADLVRPMRYAEMFFPEEHGPAPVAVARTMFLDQVDETSAQTVLERLRTSTAPMAVTQLRVLGGAVARVAPEATAYAHRHRRIMVNVAAVCADPGDTAPAEAWVGDLTAALHPEPGAYVNFLAQDDSDRMQEAYPGDTWRRLRAVKHRYDPANLFRLNHNITPDG